MSLAVISETMNDIMVTGHSFTSEEKEFVVQFAFKTGDRELTNKLIDELMVSESEENSKNMMQKYSVMYDVKPAWVSQIENLLVAIEMYRVEEAKAIDRLAKVLSAYGIDVSEAEVRTADTEQIKEKVAISQREKEEREVEEKAEKDAKEQFTDVSVIPTLREPVI